MSHPPDDDRTMLAPTTQAQSGPAREAPVNHALPVGTRVAEFELTGILGAGGFGIVYLAYDRLLERHVALKEFMPAAFALRDAQGHVHPCTQGSADAFGIGLHSFVNEARLLAHFDAPSLLKVYRFWEENGTAYMVMPYYSGRTLKQAAGESGAPPAEAELRRLLDSILDALAILHAQQCYHRDIAPDNILMLDDGRPVLLDFGAARRAIGDLPQAFTTIFKHAYAPIEQISENANLRQGPWTDLFALAGVLHFLIDGQPPPPAVGRMLSDAYVPLAQRYADRYSPSLLKAIDGALAVKPQERPQNVQEMRALLGEAPPVFHAGTAAGLSPVPAPAPAGDKRRWPLVAGGVLGLVVAAGGLAFLFLPRQEDGGKPVPHASAGAGAGAGAPAPVAASSAPSALPAAPEPTPAAPPSDPFPPFDSVVAGADPDAGVQVAVPQPKVVIKRDSLRFTVHSKRAGYVYVQMLDNESGKPQLIFPDAVDRDNRIGAGRSLDFPRPRSRFEAGGPPGVDRFLVIVSESPRDFKTAGSLQAALAGSAYGAVRFAIEEVAR